jgi:MFS family permease
MTGLPLAAGRARIGSAATFALAGALCAVWTVRIPALTDKLHLDPAGVGTAVLLFGVGAMVTMQLARVAITRLGSRRTLLLAVPGSAAMSAGIGIAPTYPWLLVAAGLFGAASACLDIGMNAQVAALERVSGRHLMNGAHAGWSVGSVLGGGLGALSAYLHMSFTQAVVGMALAGLPAALALLPTYVADPPAPAQVRAGRARLPRVIYLIGSVTCASFIVEGSIADWSGLYLRNELTAREAVAALGYPSFEAAMIVGRTVGDRCAGASAPGRCSPVVASASSWRSPSWWPRRTGGWRWSGSSWWGSRSAPSCR